MLDVAHAPLEIGDRIPFCYGMTGDKSFYSFEEQAGRSAVLMLLGNLPAAAATGLANALSAHRERLAALGADIMALVDASSPHLVDFAASPPCGLKTVFCLGDFFQRCGFGQKEPRLLVIDRNLRVAAAIEGGSESKAVDDALACLATLPVEEARHILLPAPILMVPNLLGTNLCRELIGHFEASAHTEGGIASIDAAGNAYHKIDGSKKKRRDCVITPDSTIHARIIDILTRNCLPEIKKAFQFDVCHTDRILIARYDDTGGYFLRHRDNAAPAVAFRQFAISINLNSEEYEGGYLLFPEYNGHRYRPATGAGIVFSASLLHEATPVTRGRRYVLLTFFHGAEAEARRRKSA